MILDYINKTFNNREIALISYLLVFILWTFTQKKMRKSYIPLIRAIMAWKILASIFALIIYVGVVIYGLYKIGLWDKSLIKDSFYWTFGVGLVIMMSFDKAFKEVHYFKNLVKENFKVLLIIEFIVGLYVFGIITEFILMPFVILFSMLLGYTEVHKEHIKVRKLVFGVFGIFGTIYLIYSGYHIYSDFKGFATTGNLKTLIFPILMSILFLPFAYSYTLLVYYESLFVRLDFFLKDRKLRKFAKWRILLSVNFSIQRLKQMTPGILFNDCSTKNDIIKEIKKKLKPSS